MNETDTDDDACVRTTEVHKDLVIELAMVLEASIISPEIKRSLRWGGAGVYALGAKYNDLWAGLVPISGPRGIASEDAARAYKNIPMMIYHGAADSIVTPDTSRRSVLYLQNVGAPHLYVQVPGADHEFWIRRGEKNMERARRHG